MKLGWSDGGRANLRATNNDREALLRLLNLAQDEGRLDSLEHARRTDAMQDAKTRGELAALAIDLPNRRGVREWIDQLRVHGDDREQAVRWLAEAAAWGRLTTAEYEQRVAALSELSTYAELRQLLHGLPGWPDADEQDLLAGHADRAAALAALAEAVTDGRVKPGAHSKWETKIGRARRTRDLDALLATLAARVSDQKRDNTLQELEAAHHDGRLDTAELTRRIKHARSAATDADLTRLTADLHGDARRLTQAERDEIAARLKHALDEGRLDLSEYESRLQIAYAATTIAEITPLLADLTDPPRPARRGPLDILFDRRVLNSALLPAPRKWWQYLFPKLTWKILVVSIPPVILYMMVWNPLLVIFGTFLIAGGVYLVFGLSFVVRELPCSGFTSVQKREQALIEEIQSAVQRSHRDVERVEITNFQDEIKVAVDFSRDALAPWGGGVDPDHTIPPETIEEAVRQLWCSRLYPLKPIEFCLWLSSSVQHKVQFDRAERKQLRHRYGPRPYGPLPNEEAHALLSPGQ